MNDPNDPRESLPQLEKHLTQEQVNRYAEAAGDHNAIHVDPGFAETTQYGRTIAHGMLVLAFIGEMMTAAFGETWVTSGGLRTRFRTPAFPGDTITTFGTWKSTRRMEGSTRLEYTVGCRNQEGAEVISGTAWVHLREGDQEQQEQVVTALRASSRKQAGRVALLVRERDPYETATHGPSCRRRHGGRLRPR